METSLLSGANQGPLLHGEFPLTPPLTPPQGISPQIEALRQQRQAWLDAERCRPYAEALQFVRSLPKVRARVEDGVVVLGEAGQLAAEQQQRLEAALRVFCPWKKGPFRIFGIEIDSEWRGAHKWARIVEAIAPLAGRRVADIGANNGYFMYRMLEQQPALVVGLEPVAKHWYTFACLQALAASPSLSFELLGVEHIDLYPQAFDTIFCLGILYHHRDPLGLLGKMHQALRPGGELIIDCQGIPGDQPVALLPQSRYAHARGIWWLPTQACLSHWLTRMHFRSLEWLHAAPLSCEEQRTTPWAPIASLAQFLDPTDPQKTSEGYPAPWRFYVKALK